MLNRVTTGAALAAVLVAGSCVSGDPAPAPTSVASGAAPLAAQVRMLFAGDVMLGRDVAPVWVADPTSVFAGVRSVTSAADLSAANLESPLTTRPHRVSSPVALEADPEAASLLAAAGFDVMSVANNHAGDAGPLTAADSTEALHRHGIAAVGAEPAEPTVLTRDGVRVAFLAFDLSEGGSPSGVARWDRRTARAAVREARGRADLVTVALHGGVPLSSVTDPSLGAHARLLARWGVDVVWCHGPHTVQPVGVVDPDRDGRMTVFATSLGNLLFDGVGRGALLEVAGAPGGVDAFRIGIVAYAGGGVTFRRWVPPDGPSVQVDGAPWTRV